MSDTEEKPDEEKIDSEGAEAEPVVESEVIDVKRTAGQQLSGKCKWFDLKKGFGFLVVDDRGPDVFVHGTEIKADGIHALGAGQRVEFVVAFEDDGKVKAKSVTGPGGAPIRVHASFLSSEFARRIRQDPSILTGVCKWFDPSKGYGFIIPSDGSDDLFFHKSEISGSPHVAEGQDIEYKMQTEMIDGVEKRKAKDVTMPGGLPFVAASPGPLGVGLPSLPPGYGVLSSGGIPVVSPVHYPSPSPRQRRGIKLATVKWYDSKKGYGFLTPSDGSKELFAHQSSIIGRVELRAGQTVEYTVEVKDGQPRAANVTLALSASPQLISLPSPASIMSQAVAYPLVPSSKYSGGKRKGGKESSRSDIYSSYPSSKQARVVAPSYQLGAYPYAASSGAILQHVSVPLAAPPAYRSRGRSGSSSGRYSDQF